MISKEKALISITVSPLVAIGTLDSKWISSYVMFIIAFQHEGRTRLKEHSVGNKGMEWVASLCKPL